MRDLSLPDGRIRNYVTYATAHDHLADSTTILSYNKLLLWRTERIHPYADPMPSEESGPPRLPNVEVRMIGLSRSCHGVSEYSGKTALSQRKKTTGTALSDRLSCPASVDAC